MTRRRLIPALSALAVLGACAADVGAPSSSLTITVAPLSYPGITNATYDLEVRNASNQVVFARSIDSLGYGGGDGSASYVGTCDASDDANPNKVYLTLTGLYAGAGGATEIPASSYDNPGELSRSAVCLPNADVPVTFDLTLARQANQGFFDIAVAFSNVFCSAKLDCVDQDGAPLLLLHDGDGARARTVVLGLACTADTADDGATWLYRDPVVVTCAAGTATVDPAAGPGNLTEGAGVTSTGTAPLFGAAVYQGTEQLGFNKRYWNVLLGLNPTAAGCTVTTSATASPDELVGGVSPAGTSWPYITWDVDVTAPTTAALTCTTHPVNGAAPHDGVATAYTDLDGTEVFAAAFGPTAPTTQPDPLALCTAGQTDCGWKSCATLYAAGVGTTDDFYAIDPDGPNTGAAAFEAWCGMSLPRGGWTLVGHYYSDGVSQMASDGLAVGATPVTPDGTSNQRLSDATIAAFGSATYLVQSGLSHTRNAACDTFYELSSPSTWSTATNYTSVRCSLDLTDWGAYFDPTGVSLNTQSGLSNWEKNYCRSSGGSNGTTSQWVYNGYTAVQGDDLCANGGGVNTADKWLWVRDSTLCTAGQVDCPLASCADVYGATAASDGVYAIDPDGPNTGAAAFDAYCLMSAASGGWTMVARVYGPDGYNFEYSDWTGFTTLGSSADLSPTTLSDAVFSTYATVSGDALLFYDATALCGSDKRLMQTDAVLGGVTLPAFLGSVASGDCLDDACSGIPAANRLAVAFKNTGCTQPFNPSGGAAYTIPANQLGVNLHHSVGDTRFAVQSPSWDTGIGGVNPPDASYATGDLDIAGDGISQWSGHAVTIFVR
ncbi:MAG: hypothetical protein CVU56_01565 [Deltaproteobacteria bacterium HGW-Deltaproteobacteria-14]|jgi:hypothetical protein|nr:MAG: hypothetical protein CVU56_01565 [Deltaproteobacteria bacterium HGW-Deltaproteobacteria-14]